MESQGKMRHQMTNALSFRSAARATATKPLFKTKWTAVNITSGQSSSGAFVGATESGSIPDTRKNRVLAIQIDREAEETLKSTRMGSLRLRALNATTSTSSATVNVPAHAPNSRTDVNTKVSDTDIRARNDGTRTVKIGRAHV